MIGAGRPRLRTGYGTACVAEGHHCIQVAPNGLKPYPDKLRLSGDEYSKCQLQHGGIAFAALDNGLLACAGAKAARRTVGRRPQDSRVRAASGSG